MEQALGDEALGQDACRLANLQRALARRDRPRSRPDDGERALGRRHSTAPGAEGVLDVVGGLPQRSRSVACRLPRVRGAPTRRGPRCSWPCRSENGSLVGVLIASPHPDCRPVIVTGGAPALPAAFDASAYAVEPEWLIGSPRPRGRAQDASGRVDGRTATASTPPVGTGRPRARRRGSWCRCPQRHPPAPPDGLRGAGDVEVAHRAERRRLGLDHRAKVRSHADPLVATCLRIGRVATHSSYRRKPDSRDHMLSIATGHATTDLAASEHDRCFRRPIAQAAM